MAKFLKKCKFLIVLFIAIIIIGYPFIFPLIGRIINFGELYTFDLYLKDFIIPWIAFGAVIGAFINAYLMHRRVTNQEKQIRDERFSSSVELLGEKGESTRIGGIYSLYFLAKEYPDEYLKPVCEILCAHVRTITSDFSYREKYKYKKTADEIQTIIDLLFNKDKDKYGKTIFNSCQKNLEEAFLSEVDFKHAILDNVYFNSATLSHVGLYNATLTNVHFDSATLDDVDFNSATLTNVHFDSAKKLTNVLFSNATLTHIDFSEVTLINVHFNSAKLTYVSFNSATLTHIDFNSVTLTHIDFKSAILTHISFISAKLTNVDFYSATLINIDFCNATPENINFCNATLINVCITGTPFEEHKDKEITRSDFSLVIDNKTIIENKSFW